MSDYQLVSRSRLSKLPYLVIPFDVFIASVNTLLLLLKVGTSFGQIHLMAFDAIRGAVFKLTNTYKIPFSRRFRRTITALNQSANDICLLKLSLRAFLPELKIIM